MTTTARETLEVADARAALWAFQDRVADLMAEGVLFGSAVVLARVEFGYLTENEVGSAPVKWGPWKIERGRRP